MREEKIGEGEGSLSKERFPSPSPNLSPSSPKTFDLIESPLPVFPVKTKPERNPFRLCSAAPGNLHQGWASAPPRPLPAPFMKVLGGEGWGLGKGGGNPPPFPNFLSYSASSIHFFSGVSISSRMAARASALSASKRVTRTGWVLDARTSPQPWGKFTRAPSSSMVS